MHYNSEVFRGDQVENDCGEFMWAMVINYKKIFFGKNKKWAIKERKI
ncbi:MAG TPA: hypothetical protein HA271_05465 [Methanobacterium subterraneum]|uniref:Uncharacterized protein n=1 Tax=Methanobacterium subterraneum TaxID=59277 RepID=A0A7J4TIL2_9EURY|nr:hypothetical protein [Methanobacterium subterraneum]